LYSTRVLYVIFNFNIYKIFPIQP